MTDTPIETAQSDPLQEALVIFTTCMGGAIPDICSYGLTIGESYVPFNPDDDEDCDVPDGAPFDQVWVRVTNVTPTNINEGGFGAQTCSVTLSIGLEVGVIRCLEIPEGGEAPTTSQVLEASLMALQDMKAIQCAAMNCSKTETIPGVGEVADDLWDITLGSWVPIGPLGGQYGGVWTFTAEM